MRLNTTLRGLSAVRMQMTVRRLIIGLIVLEILPSLVIWVIAPTDDVRTWHSGVFAYMAVHAFGTCEALAALVFVLRVLGLSVGGIRFDRNFDRVDLNLARTAELGAVMVVLDVAGTLLVAAALHIYHHFFSLWDNLGDYIELRGAIYVILVTVFLGLSFGQNVILRHRAGAQ